MKAWIGAIALVGTLASGSAMAADGNNLMTECRSLIRFDNTGVLDEPFNVGKCIGVVNGVMQTLVMVDSELPKDQRICLPANGVSNGQAARIVVKLMEEHPAQMSEDDGVLITVALRLAFPCKK